MSLRLLRALIFRLAQSGSLAIGPPFHVDDDAAHLREVIPLAPGLIVVRAPVCAVMGGAESLAVAAPESSDRHAQAV